MDYSEAETILRDMASTYSGWSYDRFGEIKSTISKKTIGRSGVNYLFAVDVDHYNDGNGDYIEVVFSVVQEKGRKLLPKMVAFSVYLKLGGHWDGVIEKVAKQ